MDLKLYEISNIYKELEELEAEEIQQHLENIKETFDKKAENIAMVLDDIQDGIDTLKKKEEEFKRKRQALEKNKENLKEYLKYNMLQLQKDKIKTPYFNISIRNTKPTIIIQEGVQLPKEYLNEKITITPDKDKLQKDLKAGKEIIGVSLQENKSLIIK